MIRHKKIAQTLIGAASNNDITDTDSFHLFKVRTLTVISYQAHVLILMSSMFNCCFIRTDLCFPEKFWLII